MPAACTEMLKRPKFTPCQPVSRRNSSGPKSATNLPKAPKFTASDCRNRAAIPSCESPPIGHAPLRPDAVDTCLNTLSPTTQRTEPHVS